MLRYNVRSSFVVLISLSGGAAIVTQSGHAAVAKPDQQASGPTKTDLAVTYRTASNLDLAADEYSPTDFGGVTTDLPGQVTVYVPSGRSLAEAHDELASLIKEIERREALSIVGEKGIAVVQDDGPLIPVVLVQTDQSIGDFLNLWKIARSDVPATNDAQVRWQKATDGRVGGWIPDWDHQTLNVQVSELTREDISLAQDAFGVSLRLIVDTHESKKSSISDSNPHYGGAAIGTGADNPICSSGFTVSNKNGTRFMLTAGHCGSIANWKSPVGGYQWGNTGGINQGQNQHDDQYISGGNVGTFSPTIYIGSSPYAPSATWANANWDNSGTSEIVKGSSTPSQGSPLIVRGARTGQSGGYQVATNSFACPTLSGVVTCGVKSAPRSGGSLTAGGDSGGPVYWYQSNQLRAVGIDIGGNTDFWFTPIDVALNDFGMSLVTG